MASALSAKYGVPVTSVTLTNAIAILDSTGTYATTIFAQGALNTANGGYIYFTKPASEWVVTDNYYYRAPAYLNGEATEVLVKITDKTQVPAAGLYEYSVGQDGLWSVKVATTKVDLDSTDSIKPFGGDAYTLVIDGTTYIGNANTKVVYVPGASGTKDPITSMKDLFIRVSNGETDYVASFVPAAQNVISILYVTAP